ncbi:phage neck terminator protein [Fluviispira vulneris]|uniref:phage neck terminator protein n=1 Tax=Fluviispira vulneris TaxID=2763012 RepID=UPI001647BF98|nr:hypothetical protein [Fluviispira vulneris]
MSKINEVVYDWLSNFATTVYANQSIKMPKYPFIIYKISNYSKQGFDQNIYNLTDDEIINFGNRTCQISIDVYDKENGIADEISQNIIDSIETRKTLNHFKNNNIYLSGDAKSIDLTQFIKSKFEQRFHIDIHVNLTTESKEMIETIKANEIAVKGEIK